MINNWRTCNAGPWFSPHEITVRIYWRESTTLYLPSNVQEKDHYNSGGLMIWESITLDGRTQRYAFVSGAVTAASYRNEILEPYVRGCSWR
ncbi:hypothetical protein TNCV_952421 [Trichonephila clavipes]|nr:hypothetical protein TNCV_952421 [Trichonephila clavipes]